MMAAWVVRPAWPSIGPGLNPKARNRVWISLISAGPSAAALATVSAGARSLAVSEAEATSAGGADDEGAGWGAGSEAASGSGWEGAAAATDGSTGAAAGWMGWAGCAGVGIGTMLAMRDGIVDSVLEGGAAGVPISTTIQVTESVAATVPVAFNAVFQRRTRASS